MTHWEAFWWSFSGAVAGIACATLAHRLGGWLYDRTHPEDPGDET